MASREHDGEQLAQLLREEHARIPASMWGFFFPVTIGVWRFLHERYPNAFADVGAEKRSIEHDGTSKSILTIEGERYLFVRSSDEHDDRDDDAPLYWGAGASWLIDELFERRGATPDLVAEISSWFFENVDGRDADGMEAENALPLPPRVYVDRLAGTLRRSIDDAATTGTLRPALGVRHRGR